MADKYRWERIERLLHELKYEITRGMMEGEIDETLSYSFCVPTSKVTRDGVVICKFETRPTLSVFISPDFAPRLKLVGDSCRRD